MATDRIGTGPGPLLGTLFRAGAVGGLSDAQLLERFLERGEDVAEDAFATLVTHHGPMVLRVCREVLRDRHDAEDAFQATFLVLARQARSVRRPESLASWLHGVALRVASRARAAAVHRQRHERRYAECPPSHDPERADLGAALHEEIGRLPESDRLPLVLCYLEGLTHDQAAERLNWPVGTVRSRMARARRRLRERLARRGILPSALAWDAGPIHGMTSKGISATLLSSTVDLAMRHGGIRPATAAVLALADGASRPLMSVGFRWLAPVLLLVAFGVLQGRSGGEAEVEVVAPSPAPLANTPETPLELTGKTVCDPDTVTRVRLRFDALVEKVHVSLGQAVRKGDPLVDLRSTELADAKADFQAKYVRWQHAARMKKILQELVKTGPINKQRWVDTQNDEKKSLLDYTLAGDKLKILRVPQAEIEELLVPAAPGKRLSDKSKMTLLAPCDGIVLETHVAPGERRGRDGEILVLSPLDPLWVVADVPKKDFDRVKPLQGCEVRVPGKPEAIRARVERISPIDPVRGTAKIRTSIPNPGRRLRPDLPVRIRFDVLADKGGLHDKGSQIGPGFFDPNPRRR